MHFTTVAPRYRLLTRAPRYRIPIALERITQGELHLSGRPQLA